MVSGEFKENGPLNDLEAAFRPSGVIEQIAQAALEQPAELSQKEVADVILPPKSPAEPLAPRWQLIEGAKSAIIEMADTREEDVLALANRLGMRKEESLPPSELSRIQPDHAVWVVEGGANRTSIVRRNLAEETILHLYGAEATQQTLFQFGSDRSIPRLRGDKPNAEYGIAQEIAGDFLPADDTLTEFGLNLASALQNGYEVTSDEVDTPSAQRMASLRKAGLPQLILVQPYRTEKSGLEDGFSAVAALTGGLNGKQLVIATNGPYRPKDEVQADRWAAAHNVGILPSVALGDEPGYRVVHAKGETITADRKPIAYVNEAVILHRLVAEQGSAE